MVRSGRVCSRLVAGALGLVAVALATIPLPGGRPVQAQPPAKGLPDGLKYVPTDAALFAYADVAKLWNHAIVKDIRKADAKTFDMLTDGVKAEFGVNPDDVNSIVVFVPKLSVQERDPGFGVVVTFSKPFDKARLQKGVEKLLPTDLKPKVLAPNATTALVLMNLDEAAFGKPRPATPGPLSDALKDAASGKFIAVAGSTLANLPDEIRGDDVPAAVRAFQPLFKANTVTATLDATRDLTLDVKVRAGTAGQAVECEKAMGALLALIQDEVISGGLKELEPMVAREPGVKDLVTLLKAAGAAAKGAKFSTLGNESRLTVTLPSDLPFTTAYLTAYKTIREQAAVQTSLNNMRQIGIALHNYHDVNNAMPPAAVCDKTGKPQLSWRVLILPYLEQDALYKKFKLDEPWDSANNKPLLAMMPKVYGIPGKTGPGDAGTHYRVFVGNGAGWDWIAGGKLAGITDGTSNTIACVTAADAVPWTKPDELEFDPEKDMGKLIGLVVNGRAQIVLFDGSVRSVSKIPKKETLNALITKGGGEVVGDDF